MSNCYVVCDHTPLLLCNTRIFFSSLFSKLCCPNMLHSKHNKTIFSRLLSLFLYVIPNKTVQNLTVWETASYFILWWGVDRFFFRLFNPYFTVQTHCKQEGSVTTHKNTNSVNDKSLILSDAWLNCTQPTLKTLGMHYMAVFAAHKNSRKALLLPSLLLDLSHHVRKTGSSRRVC